MSRLWAWTLSLIHILAVFFSLLAAYGLTHLRIKHKMFWFLFIYSGTIFPFQVYLIPIYRGDVYKRQPVYECTEIRKGLYAERNRLGRNVRGLHAKQYQAVLKDVKVLEHGPVFTMTKLIFELEGTYHSSVILKMYRDLPKIDFTYQVAKTCLLYTS